MTIRREKQIRLRIIKLLRKDRYKEWGSKNICHELKNNGLSELGLGEVKEILKKYVSSGTICRRLVGNTRARDARLP